MNKTLKRFYMSLIVVMTLLVGTVMYSGCRSYMNDQGQEVTSLTPEATETFDKASEIAPVVTDALVGVAIAFPAIAGILGIVGGVITGLAGAYKKYRPELTAEQDKAKAYSDVTKAIVYAIERFKESNGENWTDLKIELKNELMDKVGPEALAIIESLVQAYYKAEQTEG